MCTESLFGKGVFYEKVVEKISILLNYGGCKSLFFPKSHHRSPFFWNVRWWHKVVTFFQKMSEKYPPKIVKIMVCYGKTLFVKSDKVAELTFLGRIFSFYGLRFDPNLNMVHFSSFCVELSPNTKRREVALIRLLY